MNFKLRGLDFEWETAIIRALVTRLGGEVNLAALELQPSNDKHGLLIVPADDGSIRVVAT